MYEFVFLFATENVLLFTDHIYNIKKKDHNIHTHEKN